MENSPLIVTKHFSLLLCRVKLITGTHTSCTGQTLALYFGFPALRLAASKSAQFASSA
jgi:hypothetical protein